MKRAGPMTTSRPVQYRAVMYFNIQIYLYILRNSVQRMNSVKGSFRVFQIIIQYIIHGVPKKTLFKILDLIIMV